MNRRKGKKELLASSITNGSASRSNHKLRKAESQVAVIREFYEAGKEMLLVGSDKTAIEEISRKYLIDVKRLGKARQFAEQYTAAEVDELCSLLRPDGSPLQVGYLDSLLSLPWQTESDRRKRAALAREAAEKGWTTGELADEKKARFPESCRKTTSGKRLGRPRKARRPDRLIREIKALLSDLTSQTQNSNSVVELHGEDLIQLQSDFGAFAAMLTQSKRRAA